MIYQEQEMCFLSSLDAAHCWTEMYNRKTSCISFLWSQLYEDTIKVNVQIVLGCILTWSFSALSQFDENLHMIILLSF